MLYAVRQWGTNSGCSIQCWQMQLNLRVSGILIQHQRQTWALFETLLSVKVLVVRLLGKRMTLF